MHAPDGTVTAVNGSGAAPAALDAARVRAALERDPAPLTRTGMPVRGPHTVTVPGVLAAWETLRLLGAALPLHRLLRPAIAYAAEGCAVSRSLAATLAWEPEVFAADPGLRDVFFRAASGAGLQDDVSSAAVTPHPGRARSDVRPLVEGERFVQPALAASLMTVAHAGVGAFYRGELGARYAAGLRAIGSAMTRADLAAHATEVTAPLRAHAFGHEVLTAPPNSQGYVLLQVLMAMERLTDEPGEPPDVLGPCAHALARLFRLASDERDRHLCDPNVHAVPLAQLLDAAHVAGLADAAQGEPDEATAGTSPGAAAGAVAGTFRALADGDAGGSDPPRATDGDTVACVAADSEGWAVSVIQSVYHGFGAAILEPDTGIVAHDRGACFSLDPTSPNLLEGGKRPLHTLMPVMLLRDGRLRVVAGTMGGEAQPQIHAQVLSRLLGPGAAHVRTDTGHAPAGDLAAALAAPRWIVDEGRVYAEADVPQTCLAALRSCGMPLDMLASRDETVGHAQYVRLGADEGLGAAADPRADGTGLVWQG